MLAWLPRLLPHTHASENVANAPMRNYMENGGFTSLWCLFLGYRWLLNFWLPVTFCPPSFQPSETAVNSRPLLPDLTFCSAVTIQTYPKWRNHPGRVGPTLGCFPFLWPFQSQLPWLLPIASNHVILFLTQFLQLFSVGVFVRYKLLLHSQEAIGVH